MKTLSTIAKDAALRKRCLFTVLALIICRSFSSIPTPGVNGEYFKAILEENASLNFLDALTGNGLTNLSVATLSITPYITASIIIQLLAVIFPKIQEMQKGMLRERSIISGITILTGALIAFAEGLAMAYGFGKQGLLINFNPGWVILVAFIWGLFATILSLIGKYMSDKTDKFIGNGVSLILATNILASYPSDAKTLFTMLLSKKKLPVQLFGASLILAAIIAVFVFTTFLQECEKNIPVNYSAKMSVGASNKRVSTIPIKLCPGGVVPIIFASSLLTFPVVIAQALGHGDYFIFKVLNPGSWFEPANPEYSIGAILYILLIIFFSYFYADITLNIEEISRNIRKAGGNISGIRAGKSTEKYLRDQTKWAIGIGGIALTIIALIPLIVSGVLGISKLSFLGTSIIITVGVVLETKKQLIVLSQKSRYMDQIKRGGIFHA